MDDSNILDVFLRMGVIALVGIGIGICLELLANSFKPKRKKPEKIIDEQAVRLEPNTRYHDSSQQI